LEPSVNQIPVRSAEGASVAEEIANSVSHGLALAVALAALPALARSAGQRGDAAQIVGAVAFATTTVLLYLASTLYHALPRGRAKRVFRVLDHSAIFLLIAGTYTPFALGALRGPWGSGLLAAIWGLATAGIALKAVCGVRYPVVSTSLYLCMGWLVLIAAKPLLHSVPPWGVFWLLAGGLAYTAGVGFFAARRVPFSHFVWHLFVALGTTCHFVAVLRYAA
jgi:hemolysin III